MEFKYKLWESRFLGRSVMEIDIEDYESWPYSLLLEYKNIVENYISWGKGYATARTRSSNVSAINILESLGFYYLVDSVDLIHPVITGMFLHRNDHIRSYKESDLEGVKKIARTAFKYSRWHKDPLIDSRTANEMHESWAGNCCNKERADEVFVYDNEDEVYGFIALKEINNDCKIELIAVDPNHSNLGIGKELTAQAYRWAQSNLNDSIIVRTELINIPAMNLYIKSGYRIADSYTNLGYWYDNFTSTL